jgi:hypothetical protein
MTLHRKYSGYRETKSELELNHEYQDLHTLCRLERNGPRQQKDATSLERTVLDLLTDTYEVKLQEQPHLLFFKRYSYAIAPRGYNRLRTERKNLARRATAKEDDAPKDLMTRLLILSGEFNDMEPQAFDRYLRNTKNDVVQRVKRRQQRKSEGWYEEETAAVLIDDVFDALMFTNLSTTPTPSAFDGAGGEFGGGGASAAYDAITDTTADHSSTPVAGYAIGEALSSAGDNSGGVLDAIGDMASGAAEVIGDVLSGLGD